MDHAEAHERIADLALEADGLGGLAASTRDEDRALLDHIRGCPECRADIEASRRLRDGLRGALTSRTRGADIEPIAAPDSLRTAILDAAHAEKAGTAQGGADPRVTSRPGTSRIKARLGTPNWTRQGWAAGLAAALVVALLGGIAGSQLQRLSTESESDGIVGVVATLDRVLEADPHWVVQLRTPAGAAAGSVAWSTRDFAVLTTSLSPAPAGQVYRCWLQWGGKSVTIGAMDFADGTAYWTGSVGAWASVTLQPDTRFVVTLEPTAPVPSGGPSGPPVLQADLAT